MQGGLGCDRLNTLSEAQQLASYLNENLSFNDVVYGKGISDGSIYLSHTDELNKYMSDLKEIIADKPYLKPVATEIENGKVPFNTKAGLINYVKSHIGDKVKVTFNNGTSDIRLLEGISNTNLKTKYVSNGSVSNAELKGVKFNDTGFSIDFKNGIVVTYDFVNVTDNAETVKKISEETLEERRNEIREKAAKTGEINLDELGTLTGIPVTHMSKETETVNEVSEEKPTPQTVKADTTETKPDIDTKDAEEVLKNQSESDTIKENNVKESAEDVHERVLDRESGNDSTVRESEPVQEVEEKRNVGTEDRKSGEDVVSENGRNIQSVETETSTEEQHSGRVSDNGIRESDNSDGDSGIGVSGNDNVNDEITNDTETEK